MRILHFCNYADRIGGAEVYAQALVSAQRARGHEVALFGASPDREVDEPGLRVVRRPLYDPARLVRDPPVLQALQECVERLRPQIVHVHNVFSVALEVVDFLGRLPMPVLQTVHDYQLLCPNSWCVRGDGTPCPGGAGAQCFQHGCHRNYPYDSWGVLLAGVRQQLSSRGVDVAIAPSTYLVERLRAHGWRDVRHLPYFIDFDPGPGSVARAEAELLYVGRLEREKGIDVLLGAMPEIAREVPGVRLDIVGSGSQLEPLRALALRSGSGAAVRFLTDVPREKLGEFYSRASVCVLPSVWTENSPLVAYECLLSGLPMVGSRIGGIPELIEPACGLTFSARDHGELARQVIRFLRCRAPPALGRGTSTSPTTSSAWSGPTTSWCRRVGGIVARVSLRKSSPRWPASEKNGFAVSSRA